MKKATIQTAIDAIQKKFHGLGEILHCEDNEEIDIICTDIYSGKWYNVFSVNDHTTLKITLLQTTKNEQK